MFMFMVIVKEIWIFLKEILDWKRKNEDKGRKFRRSQVEALGVCNLKWKRSGMTLHPLLQKHLSGDPKWDFLFPYSVVFGREYMRMSIYNSVFIFFLLTPSRAPSYGGDECQYDWDCYKNGTHVCCHRMWQTNVCRKTCEDEPCDIDSDCGTEQNMICCWSHICKSSWSMCPSDEHDRTWITVIVVVTILCGVFVITGAMFIIYLRHRSRLSNAYLVNEEAPTSVTASNYGACPWILLDYQILPDCSDIQCFPV